MNIFTFWTRVKKEITAEDLAKADEVWQHIAAIAKSEDGIQLSNRTSERIIWLDGKIQTIKKTWKER